MDILVLFMVTHTMLCAVTSSSTCPTQKLDLVEQAGKTMSSNSQCTTASVAGVARYTAAECYTVCRSSSTLIGFSYESTNCCCYTGTIKVTHITDNAQYTLWLPRPMTGASPADTARRLTSGTTVYIYYERLTWSDALAACAQKGLALLAMQDVDEMLEVVALTREIVGDYNANIWNSANDIAQEGQWIWETTGEAVTDDFWNANQPSNDGGVGDCGEVHRDRDKMNDVPCTGRYAYMCE